MKRLIIILLAAAVCTGALMVGSVILQRVEWPMLEQIRLSPGELVYLVNGDGTATLRLGDGEATYGLQPVDPSAIRIAAQRELARGEGYYVETFGGALANADGTYSIGVAAIAAGGGLRVTAQAADVWLSGVSAVWSGRDAAEPPQPSGIVLSPEDFVTSRTNSVTITAYATGSEWGVVSDIVVKAWTDRSPIGATWDTTQTRLLVAGATDAAHPTTLGQMSAWLANNEGKHWSLHAAAADVLLAGFRVILDSRRMWSVGHDAAADSVAILHGGNLVARTFASSETDTNNWARIAAASLSANVMSLYVSTSAAATNAPTVVSKTSMLDTSWSPVTALWQSFPSTVDVGGVPCYEIRVAALGQSAMYRVSVEFAGTVSAGVEVRSLMIDGKRIVLNPGGSVTWE